MKTEKYVSIIENKSGLPYMFFLVFYALAMPFAESYMDKYGPRIMTITGGFGLSPFITAPAANWLIMNFGAFTTFKILGGLFAIIITLLALPLKFPAENNQISQNKNNTKPNLEIDPKNMFKSRSFYALWTTFVIGTIIGLMAIAISGPVAEELINLDSATASIYVSLFAIFNGIGRPIFGALTDKLKAKKTAIISFSLIILASLLMLINNFANPVLYFIAFSIFWLNLGGWLAIAPAATSYFFGKKNYIKNYGYLFTAYGVGAVIGNLLSGSIRDIMGSYYFVFYPTLILAALGIIVALLFLKKDQIIDESKNYKKVKYSNENI